MRIRVLPGSVLEDASKRYAPGELLEVAEAEAGRLVDLGRAEVVDEQKKMGGKKAKGPSSISPANDDNQPQGNDAPEGDGP